MTNIKINHAKVVAEYMPLAQKIALIEHAYAESAKMGTPNKLYYEAVVIVDSVNFYTDLFKSNKELGDKSITEVFDFIHSSPELKNLIGSTVDWSELLGHADEAFEIKTQQNQNLNGFFLQLKPILEEISAGLQLQEPDMRAALMDYLLELGSETGEDEPE